MEATRDMVESGEQIANHISSRRLEPGQPSANNAACEGVPAPVTKVDFTYGSYSWRILSSFLVFASGYKENSAGLHHERGWLIAIYVRLGQIYK